MKILFLIGATSRIRNFHRALTILADAGHEIRLTGRLRKGAFELPKTVDHPRISGRVNPTQRSDAWRDYVDLLRGARDYTRYFDPRYAQATRLVRRAYEIAPTEFVLFCERNPWVKRHWQRVSGALALAEDLIPSDPGFEAFLEEERPDLILVTPLVTFESYQTDFVKAAHRLGIPIVFIPFSWDNLTNKGLMRIQPDRVLVWNDTQRREAIELHGCPAGNIEITGAARFDDFFESAPSTTRAEFLAEYGLDPRHPFVLYLGSSQLTGPNEMELIRRYVESMRASSDPVVRDAGILIRPHPALRNSYVSVSYSDLPNVAVQLTASRNADQELFDSLYHAHAAVGLNTSAMLEAAIVGRPVHTLVIPGFDEGQLGTMHFHYLVEAYGGLATAAHDFAGHQQQIGEVLRRDNVQNARSRHFAEKFLRPHGIDQAVSPTLAREIEAAAGIKKRPRARQPVWHAPARHALLTWLQRRRRTQRAPVENTVIATSMSLRPVRTALEEIQQSTTPVFVGPWNDTPGNEVMYWIPFLRWLQEAYALPPERLYVISRGGVNPWYGDVAQRYLDAGSLFSRDELDRWHHRTVPQSEQDPKQAVMSPFDAEIIDRATRAFDLSEYQVLHPSLLFRLVTRLHKDRAMGELAHVLRPARFQPGEEVRVAGLPSKYVAVSLGFTKSLPQSDENAELLKELVAQLAAEQEVVIVDCPPGEMAVPQSPRVHTLNPADCAQSQWRAIAGASAFIGGFGDLAVVAAFCGVPATTFHSERLPGDHADRLQAFKEAAGWAPVSIERARRFKGIQLPA